MEAKKIDPILKDDRGLFFEVANKLEIRHIVVTTFNKNSIRGNQFRKNMDRELKVTYMDGDIDRTICCKVLGADDKTVHLKENDMEYNLSYSQIKSAKVKISFK